MSDTETITLFQHIHGVPEHMMFPVHLHDFTQKAPCQGVADTEVNGSLVTGVYQYTPNQGFKSGTFVLSLTCSEEGAPAPAQYTATIFSGVVLTQGVIVGALRGVPPLPRGGFAEGHFHAKL